MTFCNSVMTMMITMMMIKVRMTSLMLMTKSAQALWKGDLSTIPGSNSVGEEVGEDDDDKL